MAEKKEVVTLQDRIKALDKKFKRNVAVDFSKKARTLENVIPTGVIAIDYELLGIGGFEFGKFYQVKGWQGTSKSTLSGTLAANAQKKGKTVVYIDAEHAVDINYFRQLGVDFNSGTFILVQPDTGEEALSIALELMEDPQVGLVIFDSDTAMLPKSMLEAEPGTQSIGKKAKMNSENYPKVKIKAGKNNTCVIAICQYRINPGQMFGDNRVVPGGHALDFIPDVIMETAKLSVTTKYGSNPNSQTTQMKTYKNKMFVPYKVVQLATVFGKGFDVVGDLMRLGKEYDLWKIRANTVTYKDDKYELKDFREMLESNEEFLEDVKATILTALQEGKEKTDADELAPED